MVRTQFRPPQLQVAQGLVTEVTMATQQVAIESSNQPPRPLGVQSLRARAVGLTRSSARTSGAARNKTMDSQKLLVALAPLVKRVALQMRQHLPPYVELDDLVGAGTLGLVDALRKFDPSRKVKLESYARHRIRGGILDSLRTLDPASRDMRRRARRVERTYRELEATLGRSVQDEEMADALGVSMDVWHRWAREIHALGFDGWPRRETAAMAVRLPVREESWMDAPREDPFDLCYRREQHDLLNRALACLPERERLIVTLYYQQDLTMKEIAARLQVDESRVSQLHAEAVQRLKTRVRVFLSPSRPASPAAARSPQPGV